uniref:Transmembrane protein n=1 Tax=Plectus sambesii TaxID=2011161 RepID=A0A914UVG7_9BILA
MSEHDSTISPLYNVDYDDEMKPLNRYGAPECRCTNGLISLCTLLIGLVLLGSGACTALFFWHDKLAMAPGFVFIFVGVILTVVGGGYYTATLLCPGQLKRLTRRPKPGRKPSRLAKIDADNRDATLPQLVFQRADERPTPLPAAASQSDAPPTHNSIRPASLVFSDAVQHAANSPVTSSPLDGDGFVPQQPSNGVQTAPRREQQRRVVQPPRIKAPLQHPHVPSPPSSLP